MNIPGPNNYLPIIDAVKKHHANWTMKQTSRDDVPTINVKKQSKTPGPGYYNTKYDASSWTKQAPKAFFAGKYTNLNGTPGI
jgi:Sperm-tail PG-rich repeat